MSAYLAPGRHKHQDRLQGGVGLDGSISWLVHGGHAGAVELAGVALNVALQRHRPYTWLEVEQSLQSICILCEESKVQNFAPEIGCVRRAEHPWLIA